MNLNCIFFLLFFVSCSGPYLGKEVFGADEFVLDSYRIRQGKFSILEMEGIAFEELDPALLQEYPDRIHEDDVLEIVLYHPMRPDLSSAVQTVGNTIGYRVSHGAINLPDLPSVSVAGLSLNEAKHKIELAYRAEIGETEVFIAYRDRIARKVELAGLTQVPSIPVDGRVRLYDILSQARIPPDANLFKSYLVRDNRLLPVDFHKLVHEGDMSQNIVMQGGDKLYIAPPEAASLMVMGEVGVERVIPLPAGYLSLRQALAEARGIPYTGDKSYIQVIRGNIVCPKIYTLSWDHVIHLPNDSLLLMPGDIVYVAPKPITEWNRFVSQLLPSFTTLDVVGGGCGRWGITLP